MELYTTQSRGRLHIAADQYYVGSINRYGNWFTRLFTTMFGVSMKLDVHGKTYRVNKKSYRNFLSHSGNAVQNKISTYRNLEAVLVNIPQNQNPMRFHIHQKEHFYRKLVSALINGDEAMAKKMIAKGAELNQSFWVRTKGHPISFNSHKGGLAVQSMKLEATSYTPLLYAAEKGHAKVINFLADLGIEDAKGERIQFERKIDRVKREDRLEMRHELVAHDNYVFDYWNGQRYVSTDYHFEPRYYNRTYVHTYYTDEKTKIEDLSYNSTQGLQKQAIQNPKTEKTQHIQTT